jgi:serine/threonine-protein kinase
VGAATAELRARGLRAAVGQPVASRRYAEGQVAGQSVDPGTTVRMWTRVALRPSSGPPLVDVPKLAGQGQAAARAALKDLRLAVGTARQASLTVPRGLVVRTEPGPGQPVREGGTVTLVVSTGPPSVAVPGVLGQAAQAARRALQAAGLQVRARLVFDDTVPAGSAVGTDPAGGGAADVGSVVTLLVSKGPDLVAVPNVVGMSKDRAFKTLQKAGLHPALRFLTFGDHVIEQSIDPGTKVRRGTTVELVLNAF